MKKTFTYLLGGALFALFLLMPSTASATITAKWDWKGNAPDGIRSITTIQNSTGTVASDVDGVTMFVDASSGKLAANGDNAQFNSGTILRVPVVSTSDVVTFTPHSSSYKGVTIGDDDYSDTSGTERTHTATAAEVQQGYVQITSKGGYLYGVQVELAYMPSAAPIETQLAKWTFDTGYDVSSNIYTPNSSDWAAVGWNGFGTLPQILPNEFSGTQSDYYVSAKGTRYWGIQDNNGDKIMSLYQDQDPNNITDYTDASQHNQYFEIAFPTIGYKDVCLTFAFTCGSNTVRNLVLVYSTDNGTTWIYEGAYAGAANWWVYNTNNVSLPVGNMEKVIVRLIAANEATDQWRINEIKINAFSQTYTTATIGSTGWATFSYTQPTDFTSLASVVDAYQVTGFTGTAINKSSVTTVAAEKGLLLNAAAGTYAIPLAASGDALSGNQLVAQIASGTVSASADDKYRNYVLVAPGGIVAFKSVTGTNTASIGAGKAYLHLDISGGAPSANFLYFDDETTGVNAIEGQMEEVRGDFFDLQGRKVAQPTKGLYIVNGKKVIIK